VHYTLANNLFAGGVFTTTAPVYASEVLPLSPRVYLTRYTNKCFAIGQLIAASVLENLLGRSDEWSHRIPFAIQWGWLAFLFPIILFAPKPPWHLIC
jgi:SP family general alpha glucoside:H+ symporter-like MFS transporter